MTFALKPLVCVLDTAGYLTSAPGRRYVKPVAGDNPALNPTGFLWTVTFQIPGVTILAFDIFVEGGKTLDLSMSITLPDAPPETEAAAAAAANAAALQRSGCGSQCGRGSQQCCQRHWSARSAWKRLGTRLLVSQPVAWVRLVTGQSTPPTTTSTRSCCDDLDPSGQHRR